jgi:multiple sugar transport system substrate-binding protein
MSFKPSNKTLTMTVAALLSLCLCCIPSAVFAEKVFTVYWNSNHYYDAYKQVFDDFAEKNNVTMNVETYLWNDMKTKLLTDFSGGTVPDLIEVPAPWIPDFASKGTLVDITSRVKGWPESEDWFDSTWEEVTIGNSIYGMKLHHTAFALFYNKGLFKKAGLDPDQPPKTLIEFKEYVKTLTEKLGPEVLGFGFDQDAGYMINFFMSGETPTLLSEDGKSIAINTPKVAETLAILQEIAANEWALIAEPGASYQSSRRAFFEEKIAMMLSGPWDLATLANEYPDIDYGLAVPPHLASVENPKILVAGTGIAIPEGVENADLVWELMKELTQVAVELQATKEAGMLMPRKAWAEDPSLKDNEKVAAFAQLLPNARPFDIDASVRGLSSIMWSGGGGDLTTQLYQNILYGRKPAAEALEEYVKAGDQLLD